MGMTDTCRVCLCGRRRLHPISNTSLQETWEKLTNAKFNTDDGKSLLVCYICCAQLRSSHQLRKRALEADRLLTAIVNNGSEESQNALLLIASQTFGFDYNYVIEHLHRSDCEQFVRNTVDEIKVENEGESEEDNEKWSIINIKEEKADSSHEDNLDNADVESDTPSDDDTPLKQILEREVQIVFERIDIGASATKCTVKEEPLNAKRMKLDETTKDRNSLSDVVLECLPKNNCNASHKSFTKNLSVDSNVKISEDKQNIKSVGNCHLVNKISPKVNIVPKHKVQGKNVFTQNNKTTAQNEIFKQCIRKSADAVAPSTSLDGGDEGKQSSVCDLRKGLENGFSCHTCRYKCVTKSELNIHLHKHTVEKPYVCGLCDYRCSRKGYLETHIKFKHTKEKNFSCHVCQYKCVKKGQLNVHLRKHTGEKPYICDFCDYRCSERGSLESHMKYKHIKEKNFSCHMCQYKCVTKSKLNIHLRKHTVEKPYICGLCDYKCSEKGSLESHMKYKHIKVKNFSCHMCQYKCVTKRDLIRHLRKHTGEKPYKCDFCDYKCSSKSTLNRHIILKHAK